MTHNDRHERFQKLRNAGFDSETARRYDRNQAATDALIRRRNAGQSPDRARETVENRSIEQLRAEAATESASARRLRNVDRETKDAQWSRWSATDFPRTIKRVGEAFRGEFRRQGRSDEEIEDKLWGLVWDWYMGQFEWDDLVNDADIFEDYP